MPDAPEAALAFATHDHRFCAGEVLAQVGMIARAQGLRLTPVRRHALEILLEAHRALGAYEVLDRLAQAGHGKQPPVAYRALGFLVTHGFAHHIRRINGFAACMYPGAAHAPVFLLCRECHHLAEAPGTGVGRALDLASGALGFTVERSSIEAVGLCPACAAEARP